jgi:dipeptidyl aminopeptidase/acylaminoacyl peptidase
MDNMAFCNKSYQAAALASAIACVTASLSAGAQDAAPAQPPLEVFGGLPTLENVVISPNGKRLAFVRISGDTRALLVIDIGKTGTVGGVRVSETKLRDVAWIDDDNVLVTTSMTSLPPIGFTGAKREWSQMVVFDVEKKKLHPLDFAIEHEQTLNTSIGEAEVRIIGEKTVIFVPGLYVTDRTMPGLFSFTLPGYRVRLVDRGTTQDTDWLIDEAGRIAAQFTYRDDEKTWEIKARTDGKMRQIATGKASIDTPDFVGFDADGSSIIARFPVNGNWIWKPLNLKQNNWGEALDSGSTFWSVIKDRKNGRIIGGTRGSGDARYVFFDNELQAHWNAVLRAFPDEKVHLVSHSDDFSRMVVEVFGARDGYVYALFDWYSHQATGLGAVYNGLTLPAEVRSVDYLAADGLRISGFLTLPRAKEAKNLPLVVMPHGGPEASDSGDFDWWPQALAAQGYAVLQPNFRGSNNNSELLEAGFGEWGRKMQTDLSDGVRDLAKRGLIDPKRVCIVGASYGGYAALAGVTLDPGVYRCAVAVAGISDMRRMRNWIGDNHSSAGQRYWDRFIGVTDKKASSVDEISPITHIAAVTVPVLLIHGRDDTVVPFEQSEIMVDALKKAGKSVEFVTLKHEDHWLSTGATRLQMLQATTAFLNTHNPAN